MFSCKFIKKKTLIIFPFTKITNASPPWIHFPRLLVHSERPVRAHGRDQEVGPVLILGLGVGGPAVLGERADGGQGALDVDLLEAVRGPIKS